MLELIAATRKKKIDVVMTFPSESEVKMKDRIFSNENYSAMVVAFLPLAVNTLTYISFMLSIPISRTASLSL